MRKFYTGIDIGSSLVKVVIAAPAERPDVPMQIIGTGTAVSKGMRHGYVIDRAEASRCIKEALMRASAAAKVQVRHARIAIGGVGLDESRSTGDVSLTPSGGVVTERDIERALKDSETRSLSKLTNRTVIHTIPLEYRVDGVKVIGKALGLQGAKLSIDTLLITSLSQHHDDLIDAVEGAGVEVEGIMASPLAASLVALTKAQKTAGVCLANIGSETLSVVVFDDDIPVSLKVYPQGSADITNTIALSFQIPLTEAEQFKKGAVTGSDIPMKKVQVILTSQLRDLFGLINTHLKSINRSRLLPAGIVITGGGSGVESIPDIAKSVLKLPSQIGNAGNMTRGAGSDATWTVAYGLCRWAYGEEISDRGGSFTDMLRHAWESLKQSFRSLLP